MGPLAVLWMQIDAGLDGGGGHECHDETSARHLPVVRGLAAGVMVVGPPEWPPDRRLGAQLHQTV